MWNIKFSMRYEQKWKSQNAYQKRFFFKGLFMIFLDFHWKWRNLPMNLQGFWEAFSGSGKVDLVSWFFKISESPKRGRSRRGQVAKIHDYFDFSLKSLSFLSTVCSGINLLFDPRKVDLVSWFFKIFESRKRGQLRRGQSSIWLPISLFSTKILVILVNCPQRNQPTFWSSKSWLGVMVF